MTRGCGGLLILTEKLECLWSLTRDSLVLLVSLTKSMRDRGYFTFQRVKGDGLWHEAGSSPSAVSLSPLQQSFSETDEN